MAAYALSALDGLGERLGIATVRAASVDRSPKGGNPAEGCHAKHESAVGEAETPKGTQHDR